MRRNKFSSIMFTFILLASAAAFLSCDVFKDTEDNYKITLMVICSGGIANNNFFVDFYVNNQVIFNFSPPGPAGVTNKSILPIGHRGKATITATKEDDNASLTILVYKDSKIDKFSNLSACNTTTGTCSNTLVLTYDVDDESNLTKTAAGTTETEEESSSSSSSE